MCWSWTHPCCVFPHLLSCTTLWNWLLGNCGDTCAWVESSSAPTRNPTVGNTFWSARLFPSSHCFWVSTNGHVISLLLCQTHNTWIWTRNKSTLLWFAKQWVGVLQSLIHWKGKSIWSSASLCCMGMQSACTSSKELCCCSTLVSSRRAFCQALTVVPCSARKLFVLQTLSSVCGTRPETSFSRNITSTEPKKKHRFIDSGAQKRQTCHQLNVFSMNNNSDLTETNRLCDGGFTSLEVLWPCVAWLWNNLVQRFCEPRLRVSGGQSHPLY